MLSGSCVPFLSACSVDSESVKMTMFASYMFVSKMWLMCVADVLTASCSATDILNKMN